MTYTLANACLPPLLASWRRSRDRLCRVGAWTESLPGIILRRQQRQDLLRVHRIEIIGQINLVVILDQPPEVAASFGGGRAAFGFAAIALRIKVQPIKG